MEYVFGSLPQIEDSCNQNSRRVMLVKNAVWKLLHDLPSNFLEIDRSHFGKDSDARQICIQGCHEFRPESLTVVLKPIEDFLQLGIGSRKELHRQTHRDARIRVLSSSHATTSRW